MMAQKSRKEIKMLTSDEKKELDKLQKAWACMRITLKQVLRCQSLERKAKCQNSEK